MLEAVSVGTCWPWETAGMPRYSLFVLKVPLNVTNQLSKLTAQMRRAVCQETAEFLARYACYRFLQLCCNLQVFKGCRASPCP